MIEPSLFKQLMAGVPAPVTVVTTVVDGAPHGATVSSFASLSLDPPLISIALIEGSGLLRRVRESRSFAVNLLGHRQTDVALAFASKDGDRFASLSWVSEAGLPHILGVASFMACDLHDEVPGGDHALLFGRVREARITSEPPLVYTARVFGTHSALIADRRPHVRDAITACAS